MVSKHFVPDNLKPNYELMFYLLVVQPICEPVGYQFKAINQFLLLAVFQRNNFPGKNFVYICRG